MRKSNIATILSSAAGLAAGLGIGRLMPSYHSPGTRLSLRSRSRKYHQQSSRQAMRAYRRAQGGPGIVLDTSIHKYVPAMPRSLWF